MIKKMRSFVRKLVSSVNIFHMIYIMLLVSKNKRFVQKRLSKMQVRRSEVKNLSEVIIEAKRKIKNKNSKVAHIIGSGWSLNQSKSIIQKSDFIIGFNFAALSEIKFDVYFIEFGGYQYVDTSKLHADIVEKIVKPTDSLVYFKNVWDEKNDVKYMKDHVKGNIPFILDYLMPCLSPQNLPQVIKFSLDKKSNYLPQYSSTAISSILLAYYLGFTDIVIHGLDFGGQYFYETTDYDGNKLLVPTANKNNYYKKTSTNNQTHVTAIKATGIKAIIPVLAKLLKDRGVSLYSASDLSPSSKLLPVFKT